MTYDELETREAALINRYLACDESTDPAEVESLREMIAMVQGTMMEVSNGQT